MNKKNTLILGIVLVALCLLIYLQIRAWKTFDWHIFWISTKHIDWLYAFYGLVLTYLAYVLRAVRWRIFLTPVRKTTTARLLAPQFVGFAALALLGRAGEMIRPYVIAKKERLTFTSQVAVWGVERIFDMGVLRSAPGAQFPVARSAGTSLLSRTVGATSLALAEIHSLLPWFLVRAGMREFSFLLMGFIVALIVGIVVIRRSGYRVAQFLHDRFVGFAPKLAHHLREKVLSFSHWVGNDTRPQLGAAVGRRLTLHVGADRL